MANPDCPPDVLHALNSLIADYEGKAAQAALSRPLGALVRRVVPKPALPFVHDGLGVSVLGRAVLLELVRIRTLWLWPHWAAWQAARVEVAQQEQLDREQEEPVEKRVVDRLVDETELQPEES